MTTARHAAASRTAPTRARRLPSPRLVKVLGLLVVPLSVVATGAVVATSSYSAFSDTTTSPQSNWTAGSVTLTNDTPGTALFTVSNLKPTDSASKCIVVTSTGSLPATVKLYVTGITETRLLASNITISIVQGTTGSCTSFVAGPTLYGPPLSGPSALSGLSTNIDYSTGLGTWATAGVASGSSESRAYRITYTLNANTPNSAQLGTAGATLTWEAQNS